jgi:hypothetical protein
MCAARLIIPRPRERSNAGTRPSRTAFCSKITICLEEQRIGAFVEHYNHVRCHESIDNLTPAGVYFGRAETILAERKRIKLATIAL